MHTPTIRILPVLLLAAGGTSAAAQENALERDFARLEIAIKPQPGESPWRDIDWLTNVTEARRKAVIEDKPLVIFTAADGSPLGRT